MKKKLVLGLTTTLLIVVLAVSYVWQKHPKEMINSNSSKKSTATSSIELNEIKNIEAVEINDSITWGNTVAPYNTRMIFAQASGTPYIIPKGVQVNFKFNIDVQEHVEVGFIDEESNVIYELSDGKIQEAYVHFTPEEEVLGYFYIWNKSADDIQVLNITMEY